MEQKQLQLLTPKKFLQCCGLKKSKCTEMMLGAYLGEQFLNLKIYQEGSSFDSYFISQTEDTSGRFFMNPSGRSRRSISQDKCTDLYNRLNTRVLQSMEETIEERLKNPVYGHPDFQTVLEEVRKNGWSIDQEAEADLTTAKEKGDAACLMILLLAAVFQDYYSQMGITRKVRAFLNEKKGFPEQKSAAIPIRETAAKPISPISGLRTNQTYVRRGDLLELTEQKLSSLEKMGEKRFLLLYGSAGNGKSELARAYASEQRDIRFQKEFWLTCPHEEEQMTLESLCRNSGFGAAGRNLMAQLANASSDVLLVVDNCNVEISGLINELYYHTGDAAVLITSRLSTLSGFDERNALRVISENQEQFCLEVFRKNYEKPRLTGAKKLTEPELEIALEICRRVYLNPLLISMTACFLREHGARISIGEFAENLKQGLLEAFPRYSQLDFQKDEMKPMLLQPVEVLKVILKEELNCLRLFGEEERQIMNLMVLFPCEPLPLLQICGLLGDNSGQLLMETVMDRLLGIGLLQRQDEWVAVHPLVCELILSGVLMDRGVPILYPEQERDAFYSHILEHIFLLEKEELRGCMHLAHTIYREIRDPDSVLQLLFSMFFDKNRCAVLLQKQLEDPRDPFLIASYDTAYGRNFILQNMLTGQVRMLRDLSDRKRFHRYFRQEAAAEPADQTDPENGFPVSDSEADLIFFYQGLPEEGELLDLDFSRGIDGHPVTVIPDMFLRMCTRQFRILLPEGLKRIGDWAFDTCRKLRGPLVLPDSVEHIGKGAFHDCAGLEGELHLPEQLLVLDDLAFCLCVRLTGRLELPQNLRELGEMAFCYCRMLEGKVSCPPKLKRVGERAFYNCLGLKPSKRFESILLRKNSGREQNSFPIYLSPFQNRIEAEAFYGRTELTGELKLPASVEEIGDLAFYRCGRITGRLQFPSTLRSVGGGAFFGCTGLTGSLDLPESCASIGDAAFFGCTGLEGSLRLPRKLREIPTGAFFMCSGLTELTNMEELTELAVIKEGAFFRCAALEGELFLPVQLERIDDGAFDSCSGLTGLYFPRTGNIKRLGNGSFNQCSGLKGTLHLPISIEWVGSGCFHGCSYDTCIVYNPACQLKDGFVNPDVTLVGVKGSTAEDYAKKYGNPFRILE